MTTDEMFDVLLETLGAEDFLNELVKALSGDEQRENTQKWNDMFSEHVRNAVDRAAYDVFIEMYFDGVLDGIGEGDVLARHKAEIAKAVMSAVRDAVNDGRLPF